jgi:hypothetical protein
MTDSLSDPPSSLRAVEIEPRSLPFGTYQPKGRSALVKHVVRLPVTVRRALGVNDYVIALVDSMVTACAIVLEESDVPLIDRLSASDREFAIADAEPAWVVDALQNVSDSAMSEWVARLQRADHRKILNRLLGTARLNEIQAGIHEDGRIVLMAIRFGVNHLRPWALALDDTLRVLDDQQRGQVGLPQGLSSSFFGLILNAEQILGVTLRDELRIRFPDEAEAFELGEDEVAAAMRQFRTILRANADENLGALSEVFARKVRGARDALQFSEDGVSQAANSLVELIDRIAREAFSDEDIMAWITVNRLTPSDYTYKGPGGNLRPTKRAQLECLTWAGAEIKKDPTTLNVQKIAAFSLLNIRATLQRLKHADENTPEERVLLMDLLSAIDGTAILMIRACWALAGKERLENLRRRFTD